MTDAFCRSLLGVCVPISEKTLTIEIEPKLLRTAPFRVSMVV